MPHKGVWQFKVLDHTVFLLAGEEGFYLHRICDELVTIGVDMDATPHHIDLLPHFPSSSLSLKFFYIFPDIKILPIEVIICMVWLAFWASPVVLYFVLLHPLDLPEIVYVNNDAFIKSSTQRKWSLRFIHLEIFCNITVVGDTRQAWQVFDFYGGKRQKELKTYLLGMGRTGMVG